MFWTEAVDICKPTVNIFEVYNFLVFYSHQTATIYSRSGTERHIAHKDRLGFCQSINLILIHIIS